MGRRLWRCIVNPPKLPRPLRPDDLMPPRLSDYYTPQTPEERARLATAFAVRDLNRGIRRVVRTLDRRLDVMEKRRQARERFGPR